MINFSKIGRIFYGIAIAALGFLTICYRDFPYYLIPPKHQWISGHVIVVYVLGTLLFAAGAGIVFEKKPTRISLLLGTVLLLIFCFYFIPYQLTHISSYRQFGEWENAAKELALAAGAFVITGYRKLKPLGIILFALTILSFGINHFLYAKDAAEYIPSWIPNHLFWIYVTGTALVGSSIAIILKIKRRLAAALLGEMIFIWVIILHIPKTLGAPPADNAGEITSAFLAFAYCGIAFVIAGSSDLAAKSPK
jgi:hypothetical protein